jgi:transcriptional regulator with XRE-family HTH domain
MDQELRIGKILKRLMEEQAESLASISKTTGVPKSTISEWLSNRSPNPTQAVKVAKLFGVTLHYLLFGTNDSQEPIQRILKEDFFKGTFEITVRKVKLKED